MTQHFVSGQEVPRLPDYFKKELLQQFWGKEPRNRIFTRNSSFKKLSIVYKSTGFGGFNVKPRRFEQYRSKSSMLADRFADFNVKSDKGKTPLMQ